MGIFIKYLVIMAVMMGGQSGCRDFSRGCWVLKKKKKKKKRSSGVVGAGDGCRFTWQYSPSLWGRSGAFEGLFGGVGRVALGIGGGLGGVFW
jgi:hypothetical protein